MDTFEPFQVFIFDNFTFNAARYEEYSQGKLLSQGNIFMPIICKTQDNGIIKTYIANNTLEEEILSEFEFDMRITLHDRMQLTIAPRQTNVEDIYFSYLEWCVPYTREYKSFAQNEPIVGHLFLKNMTIVKITFKMTNPERIIEFY